MQKSRQASACIPCGLFLGPLLRMCDSVRNDQIVFHFASLSTTHVHSCYPMCLPTQLCPVLKQDKSSLFVLVCIFLLIYEVEIFCLYVYMLFTYLLCGFNAKAFGSLFLLGSLLFNATLKSAFLYHCSLLFVSWVNIISPSVACHSIFSF